MNETSKEGKASNLPLFAVVPNKGKGRVLEYHGNGYFTILLPGDIKQYSHRKNLVFTNKGPGKKKREWKEKDRG